MELGPVVVPGFDVVEEVRHRLRRGVGVELDDDLARGRVELDARLVRGERGKRRDECDGGCGDERA
jgi:hypothetical protein